MKHAKLAWQHSAKIIESIYRHPFNRELSNGTLDKDKFSYYIEQDTLYLEDYARALALVAAKAPLKNIQQFLLLANTALVVEQEVVHQFFKDFFNFQHSDQLSLATIAYTSYLLRICANEPVEVALASLLPCAWVYREVGLKIANETVKNNPYAVWIHTYSSQAFSDSVNDMISIYDEYAEQTTDEIRQRMCDAFYKSTCLEWHFWNDAYNHGVFDEFNSRCR